MDVFRNKKYLPKSGQNLLYSFEVMSVVCDALFSMIIQLMKITGKVLFGYCMEKYLPKTRKMLYMLLRSNIRRLQHTFVNDYTVMKITGKVLF